MTSDYFMRQIENMTRFVASVIFARRPTTLDILDEEGGLSEGSLLRLQVKALLDQGDINGAENRLFAAIQEDAREEYLPVALDFYETLSGMEEETLHKAGFSLAEATEGLAAICRLYGIPQPGEEGTG